MEKNEVVNALEEFCSEQGINFYENYSGRGMFGKDCVGFVSNEPLMDLMRFSDYLSKVYDEYNSLYTVGNKVEMDSLGKQAIVYFPNLQKEDQEDEAES